MSKMHIMTWAVPNVKLKKQVTHSLGMWKDTSQTALNSGRSAVLRMTKFGLLLVLLLARTLAEEDPDPIFRAVGAELEMGYCFGVDYMTLYKLTEKGKQILGNTSDTAILPPESYKDRVSPTSQHSELLGMVINHLKPSDAGVYLRECWQDSGLINYHKNYLYVCNEEVRTNEISLGSDGGVDLVCNITYSGQKNITFKWFKEEYTGYKTYLFLDTKRSQEPIQEELKGFLQVKDKGSSLHISEAGLKKDRYFFCLVMEGEKCRSFQYIHLPDNTESEVQTVFLGVGERAVLPCSAKSKLQTEIYWETPFKKVNSTTSSTNKGASGNEMYIANSKMTNDYSLVIPSVTVDHSGEYICSANMPEYFITVCSELKTQEIHTYTGSKVILECSLTTDESANIQWYQKTDLEDEHLIYDSGDLSLNMSDNMLISKTSLIITELTEEDSGTYFCVVLLDSDYTTVDDLEDGEDDTDDETDDDFGWIGEEENSDSCILKQVTQLKVQHSTLTTKTINPMIRKNTMYSTPEPETSTLLYVGIGLAVLILLIVVVVVVVVKLKKRADRNRAVVSVEEPQPTTSEPLMNSQTYKK